MIEIGDSSLLSDHLAFRESSARGARAKILVYIYIYIFVFFVFLFFFFGRQHAHCCSYGRNQAFSSVSMLRSQASSKMSLLHPG